jgi:hypothetical protein
MTEERGGRGGDVRGWEGRQLGVGRTFITTRKRQCPRGQEGFKKVGGVIFLAFSWKMNIFLSTLFKSFKKYNK